MLGHRTEEYRTLFSQNFATLFEQRAVVGEQVGGCQLIHDGSTEVDRGTRPHQLGDERGIGANPTDT
jgi:hypothetical protein